MTYRCKFTWASGVTRICETEGTKEQLLAFWFSGGIPPDDVIVEDLPVEVEDALEGGEVEESDLGEHQDGDAIRETAESSDSDSDVEGREDQKEADDQEE